MNTGKETGPPKNQCKEFESKGKLASIKRHVKINKGEHKDTGRKIKCR